MQITRKSIPAATVIEAVATLTIPEIAAYAEKIIPMLLAEAEHNGWMVERMLSGWTYGRVRDNDKKKHPLLIPYNQLSESDKDYDRHTIVGKTPPTDKPEQEEFGYVDIVKIAGFRVVRPPESTPAP